MKFKEMKDFCNGLTDEQLNEKVRIMREEEVISSIHPPEVLKEDLVIDPEESQEGCFALSEMGEDYIQAIKESGAELKVAYKKGTPMLWEDF